MSLSITWGLWKFENKEHFWRGENAWNLWFSKLLVGFLVAQMVKNPPASWDTWVWSLGWEDRLEEDRAAHFSVLAWEIPWERSLVGYSPWGRKEVGHDEAHCIHTPCTQAACVNDSKTVTGESEDGQTVWVKLAVLPVAVQSPPPSSVLGHGSCISSWWVGMHVRNKCPIKQ